MGVAWRKTFCLPLLSVPEPVLSEVEGCLCGEFILPAPPLDPENRVAIVGLHGETELHLDFLGSAHEVENFLRLLRQAFEFAREPGQRLIEREEFVSVFFQKLAPSLEGKASFARRQKRKEELRALAQAPQRS